MMDVFHDENGLRIPKLVMSYNLCIKERDDFHRQSNGEDVYNVLATLRRERCEGILDAIYMLGYKPIWMTENDPTGLMKTIEKANK